MKRLIVSVSAALAVVALVAGRAEAQQVRFGVAVRVSDGVVAGVSYGTPYGARVVVYDPYYYDGRGVRHARQHRKLAKKHRKYHRELAREHREVHRDLRRGYADYYDHAVWHAAVDEEHHEVHHKLERRHRRKHRRGGR